MSSDKKNMNKKEESGGKFKLGWRQRKIIFFDEIANNAGNVQEESLENAKVRGNKLGVRVNMGINRGFLIKNVKVRVQDR
jgi:hypothetical protein